MKINNNLIEGIIIDQIKGRKIKHKEPAIPNLNIAQTNRGIA
jgi:hypothetical protein